MFTDKDIHCILRHLQNSDEHACIFCKYFPECSKERWVARKNKSEIPYYFYDILIRKIKDETGIKISLFNLREKDVIAGGWIENYPNISEITKNMTIKEIEKYLCKPHKELEEICM